MTSYFTPAGVVTAPMASSSPTVGEQPYREFSKGGKFIRYGADRICARRVPGAALFPWTSAVVCLTDRANTPSRFDQDGKYLTRWNQFGMPSGIAFSVNDEDLIYVFDSN
jgi:hypothetical protein